MFNEMQWIRLVLLLADTQTWLDEMSAELFDKLPISNKKSLRKKTYRLTLCAMAHIIERHYHKINRHPNAGKFQIEVPDIIECIRQASTVPPMPMPGSQHFQRTLQTQTAVGYDINGHTSNCIAIITDQSGKIITAYPTPCSPTKATNGLLHNGCTDETYWNDDYFENAKKIA